MMAVPRTDWLVCSPTAFQRSIPPSEVNTNHGQSVCTSHGAMLGLTSVAPASAGMHRVCAVLYAARITVRWLGFMMRAVGRNAEALPSVIQT